MKFKKIRYKKCDVIAVTDKAKKLFQQPSLFIEFHTELEAFSFFNRAQSMHQLHDIKYSNESQKYVPDLNRYQLFENNANDNDVTEATSIFFIAIAMECISGESKDLGHVKCPTKISVFTNNGTLQETVLPEIMTSDQELMTSANLSKNGDTIFCDMI